METQKWPTWEEIRKLSLDGLEALAAQELPIDLRARVLLQMANLYNHTGNSPAKIPELLDEAMSIGERLSDSFILIYANGAYGWYYMKTNNHARAFESLTLARQLAQDHEDPVGEQNITKVLAALFSTLGFSGKAVEMQMELYQWESENNELSARTCTSVGAMLANDEQFEEALPYYKEALALEEKTPNSEEKLLLLGNLGIANLKLKRYNEARTYAKELEECARTLEDEFFLHRSYWLYATIYAYDEQWEDSLHYGEKAYAFLADKDWAEKLEELSRVLMKAAAKLGRFEQAYKYAEQLMGYQQQLKNEDGKQKAHQFEYQLDMEKREKEFEVRLANARLGTLVKVASDVAHEIQNPLQFVKNFSELNVDLGEDLQTCLEEKNYAESNSITHDILLNSYKIRDNGNRISKIVEQLLEQTRKAEAGELEVDETNPHDFSS